MFEKSIDERLSVWVSFRADLSKNNQPLEAVWEFWKSAPYIPYNRNIDPFNQKKWPNPWEIIVENKYDDFTKALMIAWTLKLSENYKNNLIELKTLIDKNRSLTYNIVCIDNTWVLNYSDNGPVTVDDISKDLCLENLIEVNWPR